MCERGFSKKKLSKSPILAFETHDALMWILLVNITIDGSIWDNVITLWKNMRDQ